MRVMGIHDGHVASVALFDDGKIINCISEERLNHIKGYGGFPWQSIQWILTNNNLNYDDIDYFAMSTVFAQLTSDDINKKTLLGSLRKISGSGVVPAPIMRSRLTRQLYGKLGARKRYSVIYNDFAGKNAIINEKFKFYEHHLCHAMTGLYFSGFESGLIFTLDGAGDGLSGTVTRFDHNRFERLLEIPAIDTIGGFYSGICEYLGMKRLEHEYKIMGMAPYADPSDKRVLEIQNIFRNYIRLSEDKFSFVNPAGLWGAALVRQFHKDLYKKRFDHICAASQLLLEELIITWVKNWVEKTKIRRAIFSGGVFMNVKINQLINYSDFLDNVFFTPTCGDNSNAIGAAVACYSQECIKPVNGYGQTLLLGPSYTNHELEKELMTVSHKVRWEYIENIEAKVAELIAADKIVAWFNGKMEFGERALGSRSIVCNPQNLSNIKKINKAIKMRDFWMPFAGSILDEDREKYLIDKHECDAKYMILSFNTKEIASLEIPAALHPFDATSRPQIVTKEDNPRYYKMILEFKKITGIGCVLNTSFNIHGYPIVCTPTDAIDTLCKSGLDYLAMGNYLVSKIQT